MSICQLSNALIALLPGAVITRRRERDWQSATFSGVRLVLELQVQGLANGQAKDFTALIEDHEFSLPGLLVADIAVTDQQSIAGATALTVEALLLDEDA